MNRFFNRKLRGDIHLQNKVNPQYSGKQELLMYEQGLPKYNYWIILKSFKAIKKYGIAQPKKICEFGAGTGFLAELFYNLTKIKPICIEIDQELNILINKKGFEVHSKLEELQEKLDAVYTSNVLEHIEDDVASLIEIYQSLKKGGVLTIYVPALPFLFSGLDSKVGHVRRYRRRELLTKVNLAGFEVISVRYCDSVGAIAALLTKIFGYMGKLGLGSRSTLWVYDEILFPVSKVLDKLGFEHLVGKNLFLVAIRL